MQLVLCNFKALKPLTILFLTHGVLVFFAPFLMYFPLIDYILDFEENISVAMETGPVTVETLREGGGRCGMGLRFKMFTLWSKTNVQSLMLLPQIAQNYCILSPIYPTIGCS